MKRKCCAKYEYKNNWRKIQNQKDFPHSLFHIPNEYVYYLLINERICCNVQRNYVQYLSRVNEQINYSKTFSVLFSIVL